MTIGFEKKSSALYRVDRDGQHIGCLEQSALDMKFFFEVVTDPGELVERLDQGEIRQILSKLEELNGDCAGGMECASQK